MELYFMKQDALNYLKANISSLYVNYYREENNDWIYKLFDYDPFQSFIEISDFNLAQISNKKGETDLQNCKTMYERLIKISESQASDERLWAGLCNSTFYKYVRNRWDYNNLDFVDPKKDSSTILSRFFFANANRAGFFRNTLSKYWWVGRGTYEKNNTNHFALLDALGPDDLTSKIGELFYSNTFSSNKSIIKGICNGWKLFADQGIKLSVREHFRPANQYINALGGVILLDSMSADEMTDIFVDFISQLIKGEDESFIMYLDEEYEETDIEENVVENSSSLINKVETIKEDELKDEKTYNREIEGDYSLIFDESIQTIGQIKRQTIEDIWRLNKVNSGKPIEVSYGCTVILTDTKEDKKLRYNIPGESIPSNRWFKMQNALFGKKLNEKFDFYNHRYVVDLITW